MAFPKAMIEAIEARIKSDHTASLKFRHRINQPRTVKLTLGPLESIVEAS
jgi:hypothetical protein